VSSGAGGKIARPWACDRDEYFTAAYSLLGERGCDALTIAALCNRLSVTKGSFYHHFEDMPDFVTAFAAYWQAWLVERLEGYATESDLRRRVELIGNAVFLMTPGMRAMRAWARTNPTIAKAMLAPHRSAAAVTAATVAAMTEDDNSGQVLAAMGITMCIGTQHRPRSMTPEHFLQLVAMLYRGIGVENELLQVGGETSLRVHPWRRRLAPVSTTPAPGSDSQSPVGAPVTAPVWSRPAGREDMKDRYFAAAAELLAEQGSDGLTIAALVERLELTKGSFHHRFGALPAFVEQFAAEWEQIELERLDACLAERNPWRRMELLHSRLLLRPAPFDTAWRAWGQRNVVVAAALRHVDRNHERALALTLGQLLDPPDGILLAEMTLALGLGLHQGYPPMDRTLTDRVAIEWMRRMVGIDAEVRTETGVPTLAFSRV